MIDEALEAPRACALRGFGARFGLRYRSRQMADAASACAPCPPPDLPRAPRRESDQVTAQIVLRHVAIARLTMASNIDGYVAAVEDRIDLVAFNFMHWPTILAIFCARWRRRGRSKIGR
jgi:hypothetical protein